jgi:hypothetical protein
VQRVPRLEHLRENAGPGLSASIAYLPTDLSGAYGDPQIGDAVVRPMAVSVWLTGADVDLAAGGLPLLVDGREARTWFSGTSRRARVGEAQLAEFVGRWGHAFETLAAHDWHETEWSAVLAAVPDFAAGPRR